MTKSIVAGAIAVITAATFAVPTNAMAGCGVPALHTIAKELKALSQAYSDLAHTSSAATATAVQQSSMGQLNALQTQLTSIRDSIQHGTIHANQPIASIAVSRLQGRIASLRDDFQRVGAK